MDETPFPNPATQAELAGLREQLGSLRHLVKLLIIGLLISSSALCLFMFRQTTLMKKQIDAQQPILNQAIQEALAERAVVENFQRYGYGDPAYATNILARFELSPLMPTNVAAGAAPGTLGR